MWLENGELVEVGDTDSVVERYGRYVLEHAST
jgi:ABC-type polysaccharide/polyol phosphate transport system ATPase subunit